MSNPQPISDVNPKDLAGVKAVLFDIDNTLVGNEDPSLPSANFQHYATELAATLPIGLATARPLAKAKHILDACNMKGLSIFCNGAQIYDGSQNAVVVEHTIPSSVAVDICKRLQKENIFHWVLDDSVDHFWRGSVAGGTSTSLGTYSRAVDLWEKHSADHQLVEDYVPEKPMVLVASHVSRSQKDALLDYAKTFAAQDVVALVAHEVVLDDGSNAFDLFFTHKHSNKKDALQKLSELLSVPAEHIMAVGDGHNDKVIIEHVGYGVAMGNAVSEVKETARFITANWDEDGAAAVLAKLR
jgi:HAD superfamily hydrolase (TIGR01484 family)